MNTYIKAVLACFLVAWSDGCTREAPEPGDHYYRRVSFRNISLPAGQRIAQFEIVFSGARIRALNRIPDDWSMDVTGPESEVSRITGIAGHGTGWLDNVDELDQFATILVVCTNFDISGKLTFAKGDDRTDLVLTKVNFKLEKEPNGAVSRD